jgi:hypothetical protein
VDNWQWAVGTGQWTGGRDSKQRQWAVNSCWWKADRAYSRSLLHLAGLSLSAVSFSFIQLFEQNCREINLFASSFRTNFAEINLYFAILFRHSLWAKFHFGKYFVSGEFYLEVII